MNEIKVAPLISPPKYEQLQDYILKMIRLDEYPVNTRLLSEDEYAKMFGISRGTVRQAIKNLEKDGFLETIHGKGTFVRRKSSFAKTKFISFIISDDYGFDIFTNSFFMPILAALEKYAKRHKMKIVFSTYSSDELAENPADFLEHVANGCIFTRSIPEAIIRELDKNMIPYVFIGNSLSDPCPRSVIADNVRGAYLATRHLLSLGHRKIAHLAHDLSRITGKQRLQGFKQALAEAGIAFDPRLVAECKLRDEESIRAAVESLVAAAEFTAVFAGNDHRAIAAIDYLRQRGVRIPQDVSIVGFDDTALARQPAYSLTTIGFDKDLMAGKAMAMLAELLEGAKPSETGVIPVYLVERGSCAKVG